MLPRLCRRWSKVKLVGDIVSSLIRSNLAVAESLPDCCVSFKLSPSISIENVLGFEVLWLIVFAIFRAELVIQLCLLDSS